MTLLEGAGRRQHTEGVCPPPLGTSQGLRGDQHGLSAHSWPFSITLSSPTSAQPEDGTRVPHPPLSLLACQTHGAFGERGSCK